MNLNEIIFSIVNSVRKDWPKLYQIRYAYIMLGKYLQKNTDFFFSVDKKLGDFNLSFAEISSIYEGSEVLSSKIICRSASQLLKMILDRLGITCKLVKSLNNFIEYEGEGNSLIIHHWMLVVNDGKNDYFCTLSSDLPYIQMNMETKHFGVNIPYKKILKNGSEICVYEGEEIKHKVLSSEELKKIDIDIGYVKDFYHYTNSSKKSKNWEFQYYNASFYMLRESLRGNRLFYELEIEKSGFKNKVMFFEGKNKRKISLYDESVSSLSLEDWNTWLKVVCGEILDKINAYLGFSLFPIPPLENKNWTYESWLLSLSSMIETELFHSFSLDRENKKDLEIDLNNFNFVNWSKVIKQKIDIHKKYEFENIILLMEKMNALVSYIKQKSYKNIRSLIQSIGYHFIDKNHLYENNIDESGKLSSFYIANKFDLLFPHVFSCNETCTDFNNMNYSEQVVIIKEVLSILFPEINVVNFKSNVEFNSQYTPVMNRIHLYPIKNKKTEEYAIIFGIVGDGDFDDFYFFYDLKRNIFNSCNLLDIYNDYLFLSNRMKNKIGIEDLENINVSSRKIK